MCNKIKKEVWTVVKSIRKRSRGKNTRLLALKAILELGLGFHRGREIKKRYQEMFQSHFDYLYIEPLVFSYKVLATDQQISHWNFARLAKDVNFKIIDEYFDDLKVLIGSIST